MTQKRTKILDGENVKNTEGPPTVELEKGDSITGVAHEIIEYEMQPAWLSLETKEGLKKVSLSFQLKLVKWEMGKPYTIECIGYRKTKAGKMKIYDVYLLD